MAISIRETMLLREVLVTLTNISTATIKTLIDLSNGKDTSTHTVNNEISRLQASVEATTSLIAFYEQKLHQEAEKGVLGRHMEDAKVLTDALRAMQRGEQYAANQHHFQHHTTTQSQNTSDYRNGACTAVNNHGAESSDLSPDVLENLRKQMDANIGTIAAYRISNPGCSQGIDDSPSLRNTPVATYLNGNGVREPATFAGAAHHHSIERSDEILVGGASQLRRTRSTPFGGAMKATVSGRREGISFGSRFPSLHETSSLKGRSTRHVREGFSRTHL
jgi:hypothetical protein